MLYKVTQVELKHNHPLSEEIYLSYPENRRFELTEDLEALIKAPELSIKNLQQQIYEEQNKIVKPTDLRNIRHKLFQKDPADLPRKRKKYTFRKRALESSAAVRQLVALVQRQPVLYDPNHPDCTDPDLVEAVWGGVAQELGETSEAVKEKWSQLQDSYLKFKARQVTAQRGVVVTFWLQKELSFLDKYYTVICENAASGEAITMDLEGFQLESIEGNVLTETEQAIPKIEVSLPVEEQAPIQLHYEPEIKKPKLEPVDDPPHSDDLQHGIPPQEPLSSISPEKASEYDPDFEFLKGLLPQIKELNKKRKREYFHQMSSALFSLLNDQDEEDVSVIKPPSKEGSDVQPT